MGPGEFFSLLAMVVGVTMYFFIKARHTERMAMIEKGILHEEEPPKKRQSYFSVKFGMLLLGLGLGMTISFFISLGVGYPQSEPLFPALMLLFGGVGLVSSYFIVRKLKAEDDIV